MSEYFKGYFAQFFIHPDGGYGARPYEVSRGGVVLARVATRKRGNRMAQAMGGARVLYRGGTQRLREVGMQ